MVAIRQWDMTERVKMVNCARCGRELLGESMQNAQALGCYREMPMVFGRLACRAMAGHRRPYCIACYNQRAAIDGLEQNS